VPDFDLGEVGETPAAAVAAKPGSHGLLGAGVVGAILFLLFKGKSLLGLAKFLPTLASMAVFAAAEASIFGWQLAIGLTLSIFIHELGHVVMSVRHGIAASAPMFIPFLGAVITVKRLPDDPTAESEIGAGGPVAGLAAAATCSWLYLLTGQPYWSTLAMLGYGINLFNMLPVWFLDGARIATAMGPANWRFAIAALVVVALKTGWMALWLTAAVLLVMSLGRPAFGRHNLAAPAVRLRMTAVFLGLVLALTYGVTTTHAARQELIDSRQPPAAAGEVRVLEAPPAEEQPQPKSELPPPLSRRQLHLIQGIFLAVIGASGLALCFALAAGAAGGARQPFGAAGLRFAGMLFAPLAILLVLRYLDPTDEASPLAFTQGLVATYMAGLLAAAAGLLFERNHSVRRYRFRARAEWELQVLLVGAAGMLLAAFWLNRLVPSLVLLAVGAVLYFNSRRWQWLALMAEHRSRQGQEENAIALCEAALDAGPPADARLRILQRLASAQSRLGRGEALEAALARLREVLPPGHAEWELQLAQAEALLRQERYDETIALCEAALRSARSEPERLFVLTMVRSVIGAVALQRGWTDECRAQAEELLRSAPPVAETTLGQLRRAAHELRAMALARDGDAEGAESDIKAIYRYDPGPYDLAWTALVRAEVALAAGDRSAALEHLRDAQRRAPGNSQVDYLLGRELFGRGDPQGRALLENLAERWPRDFWGRRAAEALAEPAA
jgi:tetratricopeptide (TPR) repeat protein/Zn-dependent protease